MKNRNRGKIAEENTNSEHSVCNQAKNRNNNNHDDGGSRIAKIDKSNLLKGKNKQPHSSGVHKHDLIDSFKSLLQEVMVNDVDWLNDLRNKYRSWLNNSPFGASYKELLASQYFVLEIESFAKCIRLNIQDHDGKNLKIKSKGKITQSSVFSIVKIQPFHLNSKNIKKNNSVGQLTEELLADLSPKQFCLLLDHSYKKGIPVVYCVDSAGYDNEKELAFTNKTLAAFEQEFNDSNQAHI